MKKAIVFAFVLSLAMQANAGVLKFSYKHAKSAVVKSAKFVKKVVI